MNNDGRIDSPASATRSPKRPSGGDDIVGLLQHLTSQGTHLAQEQVKLVQAEVRAGIEELKEAIGAMLGAAVVGVAGFGVLLLALSFLLGDAIDNLGLATLIVAVVALIFPAIVSAGARETTIGRESCGVSECRSVELWVV